MQIVVYDFDDEAGGLTLRQELPTTPGSGPRHLAVSPDRAMLYCVHELSSTVSCRAPMSCDCGVSALRLPLQVTAHHIDATDGTLLPATHEVSIVPPWFPAAQIPHLASAIRVTDSCVYAAVRGADVVTTLRRADLHVLGYTPSLGSGPRDFNIDPTGGWLLVTNQNSHTLVVRALSKETGVPGRVHEVEYAASPVCVAWAE